MTAPMMAEIVTYKLGAYCQLRLPSGERVLISCAQTGIKISKLSLGGIIPTRIIAEWPTATLTKAIDIFFDPANPSQHPVDAVKNKLMLCKTIRDIERCCTAGSS